jgi:hypothetical protein
MSVSLREQIVKILKLEVLEHTEDCECVDCGGLQEAIFQLESLIGKCATEQKEYCKCKNPKSVKGNEYGCPIPVEEYEAGDGYCVYCGKPIPAEKKGE